MPNLPVPRESNKRVEMDLPDIGVGTLRATGTVILHLLDLENSKNVQAEIILDCCNQLGIDLEKLLELKKHRAKPIAFTHKPNFEK